jgi:hypothetical protein
MQDFRRIRMPFALSLWRSKGFDGMARQPIRVPSQQTLTFGTIEFRGMEMSFAKSHMQEGERSCHD